MTPTRKPENEGHLNIYHSNKTQFVNIYVLTIKLSRFVLELHLFSTSSFQTPKQIIVGSDFIDGERLSRHVLIKYIRQM